jgi:hypothetical protein
MSDDRVSGNEPYMGWHVTLGKDARFVIPAILAETITDMINERIHEDPADQYTIEVRWGASSIRPRYTVAS